MDDVKKAVLVDDVPKKESTFVPIQVFLPSKGKLYPESSPLCDADFIEIKEMTAREEDILTSRVLLKKGLAIDKVLDNCILNNRINQYDMLVGDRNVILLALRVASYGPDYTVKVSCPSCSENQDYTFMLDQINMKMLSVNPVETHNNIFEFELPKSKNVVRFKFLTAGEEADITKAQENFKRVVKSDIDNLVTSRMMRQIISINSNSNRDFVANYVADMPIRDARAFRDYVESIEPNVDLRGEFSCNNCGEISTIDIPMTVEFFWPTGNK